MTMRSIARAIRSRSPRTIPATGRVLGIHQIHDFEARGEVDPLGARIALLVGLGSAKSGGGLSWEGIRGKITKCESSSRFAL